METIQQYLLPCNGELDINLVEDINNLDEKVLRVMIGLAQIECLPADRNHILVKMLIGRLYNANFKLKDLVEKFNRSPKTIRKWGMALLTGDIEEIQRVFRGHENKRKLTDEALGFAIGRYHDLKNRRRNYNQIIQQEIKSRYEIDISSETLRKIFRKEEGGNKKKTEGSSEKPQADDRENIKEKNINGKTVHEISQDKKHKRKLLSVNKDIRDKENETGAVLETDKNAAVKSHEREIICDYTGNSGSKFYPSRKHIPFFTGLPISGLKAWDKPRLLKHCGLMLTFPWLDLVFPEEEKYSLERQWISTFLLGHVNIEQSKHLSFESLSSLLGKTLKAKNKQRSQLKERSGLSSVLDLCHRNGRLIGNGLIEKRAFYYDPHTKEYTGENKWLKAWIAHSKKINKGIHSDFIHTEEGEPCFVQIFDNYYDLRERFFICRETFLKLFPKTGLEPFTWIVDRGIFGMSTLNRIHEAGDNIITWEKNYDSKGWRDDLPYKTIAIGKSKNSSKDKEYSFFMVQEYAWEKNADFRRIIVRGLTPEKNEIEVSIIASARCEFTVEVIVFLMLNKWIQENDFKFLVEFLGLDQIISYRYISYEKLETAFSDRFVESKKYKELNKARRKLEKELTETVRKKYDNNKKLKKQLKNLQREKQYRKKLLRKENRKLKTAKCKKTKDKANKEIKRLKRLLKRYPEREKKRKNKYKEKEEEFKQKIDLIEVEIKAVTKKISMIFRTESRLQRLIKEEYVLPDTRAKNHIDTLKMTARNIFYKLLEIFRPMYDNYRDDCALLKEILKLDGIIVKKGSVIHIKLLAKADYPYEQRKIITHFLNLMTEFINKHFKNRFAEINIELLPSTIKINDYL